MALHKQRGCLLEFLTNDPTLTKHQRHFQNPHNHSQYQNRQKQQNAHWDTVPPSQKQVSCGSNHSPYGAFTEKDFCYLLTQHRHPHETVMVQNN
jgi:hypothetical protein